MSRISKWWLVVASYLLFAAGAAAQQPNPYIHVAFDYPSEGAQYVAPANVAIKATATVLDDNVFVTSIVLNGASGQLHQVQGPELQYTLSNLQPGNYAVSVIARNNLNRTASATRKFTVIAPGEKPPTVALRAPAGAPFINPAQIGLTADAADPDGYVVSVAYYVNGQSLGTATAAPYPFTWNNVGPGNYSFTAVATDNNGKQTTSAAVPVTVAQTTVRGNIEGVQPAGNGEYRVTGWACTSGHNASIDVELYFGGGWPQGTRVSGHTASLPSDAGIAAACEAQGAAYRFSVPITPAQQQAYANQGIYIHGVSPIGAGNLLIGNSGTFKVPAPLRISRRYVYDQYQQLCKTIEPETGATVMEYDEAGNLLWSAAGLNLPDTMQCNRTEAAASGRRVMRTYDARNRLKHLNFPDGRGNQTWSYYPDGLVKDVVTDNDGANQGAVANAYSYNRRRMLTGETVRQTGLYSWSLGYGYNANGHLTTQTYPSGLVVRYSPNALGQPSGAWDNGTGAVFASGNRYAANGALQQFTYGNGIVHTMQQNARQLPSRSTDAGAIDLETGYDANGNVGQILDRQRGDQYSRWMSYDGLDRLTTAGSCSFGGDCWHRFSYDAVDNLRGWSLGSVKNHRYVYDAKNRLTNILDGDAGPSVIGLGYDDQGNLFNKNGQEYHFDYGNRLRRVVGKEVYRYDAHGRRTWTQRISDGLADSGIYSQSGQLLYESKGRTGERNEYLYLGGSLLATRTKSASDAVSIKYQHTDALGSPVAVTNAAGQVVERTEWEPYGSAIGKPNYNGIGYTGHPMDGATGLTYMQQRYYDSTVGRFLSVDPVTANAVTGGNFNRYKYAGNNPYRFVDPDGRMDKTSIDQANAEQKAEQRKTSLDRLLEAGSGIVGGVRSDIRALGAAAQNPGSNEPTMAFVGLGLLFTPAGPEGRPVVAASAGAVDLRAIGLGVKALAQRFFGPWTKRDLMRAAEGKGPLDFIPMRNAAGKEVPLELHHADQMPGSAIHEVQPFHSAIPGAHPNKYNQGVTPQMRAEDANLHWQLRGQEMGNPPPGP
ncbi:RHS repeat-associated core domain-containing protein [Lysobacter sp. yr284]|uniref:RHS repeat domain-containing protein n=1 Tax=Lysobacter sp. yr284 TaxID=1761791 RepID=UPI00089AE9F3|nr:RHS repeat-associated core domain-containing protein [Lysobacter sp. yr284]SDY65097.1 RHS repeat-associated core domain-containing protein [Lysobacter sp. yr284]